MEIKFKKLAENAIVPKRANLTDAGLDLVATSKTKKDELFIEYGTGLAAEIPEGFVGLLFPRSSVTNMNLMLKNSVGVIDSGYRGEIKARFLFCDTDSEETHYRVGDKVAQLLILPIVLPNPVEVSELSDTERGDGGFGSSGK